MNKRESKEKREGDRDGVENFPFHLLFNILFSFLIVKIPKSRFLLDDSVGNITSYGIAVTFASCSFL